MEVQLLVIRIIESGIHSNELDVIGMVRLCYFTELKGIVNQLKPLQ